MINTDRPFPDTLCIMVYLPTVGGFLMVKSKYMSNVGKYTIVPWMLWETIILNDVT